VTAFFSRLIVPVLLVSFATVATAQPPSVQDLRLALTSAKRQAESADTLDAAYELVGIAEESQKIKNDEIATEATTTLIRVIEKATQSAMNAGIADAHDTLDQLVDLSFFSRTSNVLGADDVLQKSLRLLFPKITNDVRLALAAISAADDRWPAAMTHLGVLSELQASAALTMQDDLAAVIKTTFDAEAARLEALAGQADGDRAQLAEDIAAARKTRDEQVADANANNLATVVAELKSGRGPKRLGETEPVDGLDGDAATTCVETGTVDQEGNMYANQDLISRLEEECVLSGRLPSEDRCPTRDLFFVCRDATPDTERIIYTYRGTPEERTARENCKGDVLSLTGLSGVPPAFKNTAMRRIMSCIPLGAADPE
jgi:uncharacterized protein YdbL (DUF1318 family)